MNFFEAVQEMIKLKVCVCKGTKYRIHGRNLELFNYNEWRICNTDIFILSGMDWEVVEEPKSLSDKKGYFMHSKMDKAIIVVGNPSQETIDRYYKQGFVFENDLKEALKELFDWLEESKETERQPMKGPTDRNDVLSMVQNKMAFLIGGDLLK